MTTHPLLADYAAYIAANANVQQAMNPCKVSTSILSWFYAKLEEAEQAGMPPSAPLPDGFSTTSSPNWRAFRLSALICFSFICASYSS